MTTLGENEFYVVRELDFMKETVTPGGFTAVAVGADEAAPWLVDRALAGEGYTMDGGAYPLAVGATERQLAHIEQAAMNDITRAGLSEADTAEALHRALGDNPTVVKVGFDTFGAEVATKVWGIQSIDTATANSTERSAEAAPSEVIQNSQSQGFGPVARIGSASPETADKGSGGGVGTGSGPGASDSHGQGTSSSPQQDPKTGGDPILLASGQLCLQVTDLSVRGRGLHFAFTRTYWHQTSYRGPMGFSWDHCYNLWLREAAEVQPDGSLANVVYRSTGEVREDRYVHVAEAGPGPAGLDGVPDATFRGPAGFFDQLTKTAGVYRLQMVNGTTITYDDLRVSLIEDRWGNTLTFSYADGLLVQVTDAVGKVFDIANDACGRVVEVADRIGGRRLAYAYDDIGNLVEADIFADADTAASTDYVYLGMNGPPGLEHNLVEVVAADGASTLQVTYGADPDPWNYNRVLEQRSTDGRYSYIYSAPGELDDPDDAVLRDATNLPRSVTTVTYPNGHEVEHTFNGQGNVVRRRETLSGLVTEGGALVETLVSRYAYNTAGLLAWEQRPDGATVSYEYDWDRYEDAHGFGTALEADAVDRLSLGNLRRRVETARSGASDTRQLVKTWDYVAGTALVERQRGPYYADALGVELAGQATPTLGYRYDPRGQLSGIDYPLLETATGGTQQPAPARFTYDTHGGLTGAQVGTIRTLYDYFADELRSGFVRRRVEDADGLARQTTYEVDVLGRMTALRDSLGAETRWTYDGFDLPVRVVQHPLGGVSPEATMAYDAVRRPTRVTETLVDADGSPHPDGPLVQDYRYDAAGRLTESTVSAADGLEQRTRTLYTPWGQPRRTLDELGVATDFRYDSRNLLSRVTFASGTPQESVQGARYNRSGELCAVVDGLGHQTTIERDGFGRVHRVIDRDGVRWETDYDAQDRATRRRVLGPAPGAVPGAAPVLWSESHQEFDAAGRPLRRTDLLFVPGSADPPEELVTSYEYDPYNRLIAVRDGTRVQHRFDYDGLGRLVTSQDADGNTARTTYDDAGRRIVAVRSDRLLGTSPPKDEFFRSSVRYDERGLASEEVDGVGNVTRRRYDSRRLPQEIVSPDGRRATYDFDVLGRLRGQTLTSGPTVISSHREYDAAGHLTAVVTPSGARTEWTYDARGRPTGCSGTSGGYAFGYDAEGRLIRRRSPSGLLVLAEHTPEGRLLRMSVDIQGYLPPADDPGYVPAPVPDVGYRYLPTGQVASVTRGGQTVRYEYDSLGRVLQESQGTTAVGFTWDAAGLRSGLSFPAGRTIGYGHSPAGHLTQVRQEAPGAAYPGDPAQPAARTLLAVSRVGSRPGGAVAPGLAEVAYSYDAARRLVALDYRHGAKGLESLRVLTGPGGERLVEARPGVTRTFAYDDLLRLRTALDRPAALLEVTGFAPAGSEAALGGVAQQRAIDVVAAAAASGGGIVQRRFDYLLDSTGNRLQTSVTPAPGAPPLTTVYLPAPGDRYAQVDGAATTYDRDGNLLWDGVRRFWYDVLGRLVRVDDGTHVTTAAYDPVGRLAELVTDGAAQRCRWAALALVEVEASGGVTQLVPGDGDMAVAHVAGGGHDALPLLDDVGSVTGWVGAGGAVLGRRRFDPFGRVLDPVGLDLAPLGFCGYVRASAHELHWLSARVYDARLGRFLQPDPMGLVDGLNVYAFARNAPGTLVDALGFASTELDWGTVAWNATKTIGTGVAIVGGSAALVAGGVVSAPFVATVGGLVMVGVAMNSFFKRSDEAFQAGQTDRTGAAALAALGEPFGVTNIVEGSTGTDAVTDRVLGSQERSERLGTGIGTAGTVVLGPKAARFGGRLGTPADPMSLYSVPSISRPTYYNPLMTGRYVSPEGVAWEGGILSAPLRATAESWRAREPGDMFPGWGRRLEANSGNYWHVRRHFGDMPGRTKAHSFFDPSLREHMILLGDAPTIAQRGGTVELGDLVVGPDQAQPLRSVWRNAVNRGSDRAYNSMFVFVDPPYPTIGEMGGNPTAAQSQGILDEMGPAPAPGTPLNNGYRVILQDSGRPGIVHIVTMYPE
jgi:RHS repeat-associated protein